MLFFSHLKRVKARRIEIAELDKEISRLYAKKSELELAVQKSELDLELLVQKREAKIDALEKREKKVVDFLTLDEQIEKSINTLASLDTEISSAKDQIENLKREHLIFQECINYEELREKYKVSLQESIDNNLKKLLDTYPNIKPRKLFILNCFNGFTDNTIHFKDIEVAINTNLTKFAIAHRIDPTLYKDLMYQLNDPWVKRFNELKGEYKSLNVKAYENDQLFNGFIILVDNKN